MQKHFKNISEVSRIKHRFQKKERNNKRRNKKRRNKKILKLPNKTSKQRKILGKKLRRIPLPNLLPRNTPKKLLRSRKIILQPKKKPQKISVKKNSNPLHAKSARIQRIRL